MDRRRSFAQGEAAAWNDWQIEEIKLDIAEADRGDFASDQDVKRTLRKLTSHDG
jgi:predicted transcriptional regulator